MPTGPAWRRSAGLMLTVLLAAYILAFVDRQILSLFVQSIKRDLALTDVEISILQGLSFAIFMCIAGIPVGRMVDTRRRTGMLAIGVFLWSIATAGCGFAGSFGVLLLCRICVGVGEAVMTPAAYSLIGDSFPLNRQGLAIGIYTLGAYVGSGGAMVFGGTVIHMMPEKIGLGGLGFFHSWQLVFLSLLVPGLIVSAFLACLPEPPRGTEGIVEGAPTMREGRDWFRSRLGGLVPLMGLAGFTTMTQYGLLAWAPAFYQRTFGLTTEVVGFRLGLIIMICGSAGTVVSGLLGDFMVHRRVYGRLLVAIGAACCALPLLVGSMMASNPSASMILFGGGFFFLTMLVSSAPSLLQQVTPSRIRGLTTALFALVINMMGLGLGPTVVAVVTQRLLHNEARLGTALAYVIPTTLVLVVVCAALTIRRFSVFTSQSR